MKNAFICNANRITEPKDSLRKTDVIHQKGLIPEQASVNQQPHCHKSVDEALDHSLLIRDSEKKRRA